MGNYARYLCLILFNIIVANSNAIDSPVHRVTVNEVLQTKTYTYLRVTEKFGQQDSSQWLALPYFEPKVGDVYYYESGLPMREFHSKELNRTFQTVIFMGGLCTTPDLSPEHIVPAAPADTVEHEAEKVRHYVKIQEVLQTSGYTYLRATENGKDEWIAVVKINASPGQTFSYDDAAPMTNFQSRELKRTFDQVLFISKLEPVNTSAASGELNHGKSEPAPKLKKEIEPAPGGISIGELYKNKFIYEGRTMKIRGKVMKSANGIMNQNWIHLQDGTASEGNYDLTVTTKDTVETGKIVTVQGDIRLNKDFGSGYFFDVIMENGHLIE